MQQKAQHMLEVANLCYEIARDKYGQDEDFCQAMWVVGWNHDIGYAFLNDKDVDEHPVLSADILNKTFKGSRGTTQSLRAILYHGKDIDEDFLSLKILNEADLRVSPSGKRVSVEERLIDIGQRYGIRSKQFERCESIAKKLNLLEGLYCEE